MGLDMYLTSNGEEVGYWRKANQIHRWFVENVQGGVDDCGQYAVSREKLGELLGLVERVSADPTLAPELLPSQSGFFFGSTEYGDWYMEDIKSTRQILVQALREQTSEFQYYASW